VGVSYEPELYDVVTPETFRGDTEWYRRMSVQIDGGFDGRPFEQDTDELVIEAGVD
jgi:hypothetical protein